MYKDYVSGNVCAYDWKTDTYNLVGNWIEQGYSSVQEFITKNKNLFSF